MKVMKDCENTQIMYDALFFGCRTLWTIHDNGSGYLVDWKSKGSSDAEIDSSCNTVIRSLYMSDGEMTTWIPSV